MPSPSVSPSSAQYPTPFLIIVHIEFINKLSSYKGFFINDYFASLYILVKVKSHLLETSKNLKNLDLDEIFHKMEERLKFTGEDPLNIVEF